MESHERTVESEQPALVLQSAASVYLISSEVRFEPDVGEKEEVASIKGCTHDERVESALMESRKVEQEVVIFVGIKAVSWV